MTVRPVPPLSILIVEDETVLVMDLESVIEDCGHRVLGDIASVPELLSSLNDIESPDVALVDINLANGTNGLDASLIIRERWSNTCIVFVTANPKKVPDGHAGAHGVIPKPFTRQGLMSAFKYIEQGLCDPPPTNRLPTSFMLFSAFESCWKP